MHVVRSGDLVMASLIRYPGDRTKGLGKVLGGRFLVLDARYDSENDVTIVEVTPLIDPLKAAGIDSD